MRLVLAVALLPFAGFAQAQSDADAIGAALDAVLSGQLEGPDCAAIADDSERLACYDLLAGIAKELSEPTPVEVGQWRITHNVDPMTDFDVVILSLDSGEPNRCAPQIAGLYVRCDVQGLNLYVSHGCYAPGTDGRHNVQVRYDDEDARTIRLFSDSTDTAVGIFQGANTRVWLRDLLGADRFVIQITPYRDPPQTLTFATAGLAEAVTASGMKCEVQSLVDE